MFETAGIPPERPDHTHYDRPDGSSTADYPEFSLDPGPEDNIDDESDSEELPAIQIRAIDDADELSDFDTFCARYYEGTEPTATSEINEEAPAHRFTVVEIGAGLNPLLTKPDAPDAQRLFQQGGSYIAIDASSSDLATGRAHSDSLLKLHRAPGVRVDAKFEQTTITPEAVLPANLEPNSADRVLISNVFTVPDVAANPRLCDTLASIAAQIVDRDGGEVVVVGTNTPFVFTRDQVRDLLQRHNMQLVGSDDPGLYSSISWRKNLNPQAYADRYRHIIALDNQA